MARGLIQTALEVKAGRLAPDTLAKSVRERVERLLGGPLRDIRPEPPPARRTLLTIHARTRRARTA